MPSLQTYIDNAEALIETLLQMVREDAPRELIQVQCSEVTRWVYNIMDENLIDDVRRRMNRAINIMKEPPEEFVNFLSDWDKAVEILAQYAQDEEMEPRRTQQEEEPPWARHKLLWARPFLDTTLSRRYSAKSSARFASHMMLPVCIPICVEMQCSQSQYRFRTTHSPSHTGAFHSVLDEVPAGGFNRS